MIRPITANSRCGVWLSQVVRKNESQAERAMRTTRTIPVFNGGDAGRLASTPVSIKHASGRLPAHPLTEDERDRCSKCKAKDELKPRGLGAIRCHGAGRQDCGHGYCR